FYPGWLTDGTTPLGRPTPTLDLTPGIAKHGTRLLFLVGDGDHLYTPAQRSEIAARLVADRADHDFVVYPDTPHGSVWHERATHRPEAADDAFARVTTLLADHLR